MTKRKFLWLVSKHYKLMVRASARAVDNLETGKDSAQEIITRLLERKTYLSAEGNNARLRNWLVKVTVNEARNGRRRKSGYDLTLVTGASEVHGEMTPYVGTRMFYPSEARVDGRSSGPPCAMPKRVRNDPDPINFDVARALTKLGGVNRRIAEGCLMGHDTVESMAETLGFEVMDVRVHLNYVKDFLAKELADYKVGKPKEKGG